MTDDRGFVHNHFHRAGTVEIHEHRATTDESLRMLQEMREEARKSIIKELRFEGNLLNGVCLVYRDNRNTIGQLGYHYDLRFSINGKEYNISDVIDRKGDIEEAKIIDSVRDTAIGIIANHLFNHLKLELLTHLGFVDRDSLKYRQIQESF